MKINHSIEKLNKLQDSINTCSKKANEQLQTEIEIRDEIVNKIRKQYQRSYQQIEKQLERLQEYTLLSKDAVIVCETDHQVELADEIGQLKQVRKQSYGICKVTIFEMDSNHD